MPPRQVVIIAKGPGWAQANIDEEDGVGPFAEPDYECWGVNAVITWRPWKKKLDDGRVIGGIDKTFHMHHLEPDKDYDDINQRTFQKIKKDNIPLITLDHYDEFPSSIKFPFDWIKERFNTDYLSNSVSYMIAYAIYEEVEKIDTYGVNMSTPMEYMAEKGNVEYWIGIATGLGIKVTVHGGPYTAVLRSHDGLIYGYAVPQKGPKCRVRIAPERPPQPGGGRPGIIVPEKAKWVHPKARAGIHPSEW